MEAMYSSSDEYCHYDFTAGWDRRAVKWQNSEMELTISRDRKRHVEVEDFHILLCDLKVYFGQTRRDCGQVFFLF